MYRHRHEAYPDPSIWVVPTTTFTTSTGFLSQSDATVNSTSPTPSTCNGQPSCVVTSSCSQRLPALTQDIIDLSTDGAIDPDIKPDSILSARTPIIPQEIDELAEDGEDGLIDEQAWRARERKNPMDRPARVDDDVDVITEGLRPKKAATIEALYEMLRSPTTKTYTGISRCSYCQLTNPLDPFSRLIKSTKTEPRFKVTNRKVPIFPCMRRSDLESDGLVIEKCGACAAVDRSCEWPGMRLEDKDKRDVGFGGGPSGCGSEMCRADEGVGMGTPVKILSSTRMVLDSPTENGTKRSQGQRTFNTDHSPTKARKRRKISTAPKVPQPDLTSQAAQQAEAPSNSTTAPAATCDAALQSISTKAQALNDSIALITQPSTTPSSSPKSVKASLLPLTIPSLIAQSYLWSRAFDTYTQMGAMQKYYLATLEFQKGKEVLDGCWRDMMRLCDEFEEEGRREELGALKEMVYLTGRLVRALEQGA